MDLRVTSFRRKRSTWNSISLPTMHGKDMDRFRIMFRAPWSASVTMAKSAPMFHTPMVPAGASPLSYNQTSNSASNFLTGHNSSLSTGYSIANHGRGKNALFVYYGTQF